MLANVKHEEREHKEVREQERARSGKCGRRVERDEEREDGVKARSRNVPRPGSSFPLAYLKSASFSVPHCGRGPRCQREREETREGGDARCGTAREHPRA